MTIHEFGKDNKQTILLIHLDHRMLQTMHMFLIRPTTCSNGDEVCDYWIVAEDSEEVKKHPIVIKEDGLMINRAL